MRFYQPIISRIHIGLLGLGLTLACANNNPPPNDVPTLAKPETSDCVKQCIQQNQMRAVSPEIIEADCRKTCRPN